MSVQLGSVKEEIHRFVLEAAQFKGVAEVTDDESLVKNGVMDSIEFFRLVAFLEDNLSVRVADNEIRVENFESIKAIAKYAISKLKKVDQEEAVQLKA